MASSTVFLKDEKLRQLAQLIRNHEVNNLYHITFQNMGEQLKYLRMCNDNMASVNTLLDECNALVNTYKNDSVRRFIADQIVVYVQHCLNNALQLIRNYTMRSSYLERMMDHHRQLFQALEDLNTSSDSDVVDFTKLIEEYDVKVMNYMRLTLNSHASAEFSRYLRNTGIGFDELVRRYQDRLGFTGRFADLETEQKLEVYAAIIEASDRLSVLRRDDDDDIILKDEYAASSIISYGINRKAKFGSAPMFLISVGWIIWDVYSSDHPITTAIREALVLAAKQGGKALAGLVTAALSTHLISVGAPTLFITAVGLVGGFIGGFIIGTAAGLLFDLIFGSGGEAVLPTDGFILYVAPMPNGHDLAKQIAHV